MGDECGNTFQFVFSTLHTYVLKVTLQKRAPVNRTVSWVVTFLRYADGGDKREMSPPPPQGQARRAGRALDSCCLYHQAAG